MALPQVPDLLAASGLLAWALLHSAPLLGAGSLAALALHRWKPGHVHKRDPALLAVLAVTIEVASLAWGELAERRIHTLAGCEPSGSVFDCLRWVDPPAAVGFGVDMDELDDGELADRRQYFASALLAQLAVAGVLGLALQMLARCLTRSARRRGPDYFTIEAERPQPQLWLSAHIGYHGFSAAVSLLVTYHQGFSARRGVLWEAYSSWMSVVLVANCLLALFAACTRRPEDLPNLAMTIVTPATPVGELFDVTKDWLFVGLCVALAGLLGYAMAALAVLVLWLSARVLRSQHPGDLLGTMVPSLAANSSSAAHPGLTGQVLNFLEMATSPARVTISLTEDLPQAILQAIVAQQVHSSSQTILMLTVAKLLVTILAQVPVMFANDRHTAAYLAQAGMQRLQWSVSGALLGERHPQTLTAMGNLAVSLDATGALHEALELRRRCLTLRQDVLGEQHPQTLTAMNNLAVSLDATGAHHEAVELRRRCLTLSQDVLGEQHPQTLTAMNNLATSLHATGAPSRGLGAAAALFDAEAGCQG